MVGQAKIAAPPSTDLEEVLAFYFNDARTARRVVRRFWHTSTLTDAPAGRAEPTVRVAATTTETVAGNGGIPWGSAARHERPNGGDGVGGALVGSSR